MRFKDIADLNDDLVVAIIIAIGLGASNKIGMNEVLLETHC